MSRRTGSFVLGLCLGAVCARNWRPLTKGTIKAGLTGGTLLKAGAARAAENLSDVTHEVRAEMDLEGQVPDQPPTAETERVDGPIPKEPVLADS